MATPRLAVGAVAVVGLLVWQREAVLEQLGEQWDWVAIFGAGAFLGWSYYSQLSTVLAVIPL